MLPHSSRNPAEDNTVEGRLANMSQGGYLHVARSSAELSDVLDKIKVRSRDRRVPAGWAHAPKGRRGRMHAPLLPHQHGPAAPAPTPQDNLRQEQRAVMDINCTTVAKVLSPLQSAHYLLNAYPQHCDALALGCAGTACQGVELAGPQGMPACGMDGRRRGAGCPPHPAPSYPWHASPSAATRSPSGWAGRRSATAWCQAHRRAVAPLR